MLRYKNCTRSTGFYFVAILILLLSRPLSAQESDPGDNSKSFGDYDVFYNVLNSTFIKPDVAARYGIVRGKDKALINIAVRKRLTDGKSAAHAVEISGTSSDLIHSLPLQFREIKEHDAIYYIAELSFHDKELRSFTILIKTEPGIAPYTLKFNKTLYEEKE